LTDPPVHPFEWKGSHRLILSRYSEGGTVLSGIADSEKELADLALLDGATNGRIAGEQHGLIGITPYELVYGIPNAHIVRAAYTYPGESGSRFNDNTRGAWYAADSQEGSIAEVSYHKARHLTDIIVRGTPGERPGRDVSMYDDWLADFQAEFHVLEPRHVFSEYLQPAPLPECYAPSQALARYLLSQRSNGVVYPSVRHAGSQCIACFRPALVYNPRRSERLEITLTANDIGYDRSVRRVGF
jgi:RES domain-containing protein